MTPELEAFYKLQQDISANAGLGRAEATGFYTLNCPVCKKMDRKTGGFKFENDKIVYNCFRGSCDASCVYELDNFVPKKFKNLMEIIGVKIPMLLRVKKHSASDIVKKQLDREKFEVNEYKEMQHPEDWVLLADSDHPKAETWKEYLINRCCSLADIFFFNKGQYRGLIAIAIYHGEMFIGYQVITGNESGAKYILVTDNEGLIYCPEREIPKTAIIVEGALDANCFPNTVAVFKSKISPKQAYHLRHSQMIFLPDRTGNNFIESFKFYEDSKFCVPDWNYKDLNAAVCEIGVIEAATRIMKNIVDSPAHADVKLGLWKKE
jgi:hypothetical protein